MLYDKKLIYYIYIHMYIIKYKYIELFIKYMKFKEIRKNCPHIKIVHYIS